MGSLSMSNKYIYFTVEIKVRELDSKILLAIEAAKHGYVSIIGTKPLMHRLNYYKFPKGIYFYKDSIRSMVNIFRGIKESGHNVVVHDEEGFVQFDWNRYLNTRIKSSALTYVDKYLCWGKMQYEAINNGKADFSPYMPVKVTGHPRIDLLKDDVNKYNKIDEPENRKVILINTKLGVGNYKRGADEWLRKHLSESEDLSDSEKELLKLQVDYESELLTSYNKLIRVIVGSFPDHLIIIRPQPVEDIGYWKDRFSKYGNVNVTREKPIGYWLHKADVIVHTGCTTAIEGLLMGVPAVAFKPIFTDKFNVELPNSISFNAETEMQCVDSIKLLLQEGYDKSEHFNNGNAILSDHIFNLEKTTSTEIIVDELDEVSGPLQEFNFFNKLKIRFGFTLLEYLVKLKCHFLRTPYEDKDIILRDEVSQTISKIINISNRNKEEIDVIQLATNVVAVVKK
jgi:surface carbohydrate biosynthesis protein